jgi:hypothetical protein
MTTRRNIDRVALRGLLRKKFPGGPREALRKLGVDASSIDAALALDGANTMPNRLQFLAITRTAAALNPLLAVDAKVDYAPLFKGVTTKNLKAKSKQIVADAKKILKGKTIAKDAPMEHFAQLLNHLEHVPDQAQLDESVSEPQHKAMEAAAHGTSNIGIPKDVGKEFSRADVGKSFDEMLMDWAKDKGMSEDDMEALKKMHSDSMPENALDEDEDDEEAEDESEEKKDEEAEDESEEEEEKKPKGKDKKGAMDTKTVKTKVAPKGMITEDQATTLVEAALAKERKANRSMVEAREFVRPYVGDVSIALDSAAGIYRAAAEAMAQDGRLEIEADELKQMNEASLRVLMRQASRRQDQELDTRHIAQDEADDDGEARTGFDSRWGGADSAGRIGHS